MGAASPKNIKILISDDFGRDLGGLYRSQEGVPPAIPASTASTVANRPSASSEFQPRVSRPFLLDRIPAICRRPGRDPRRGRIAYEPVLSNFKSELQRTKSPLGAELILHAKPGFGKTINRQPSKVDI